MSTVNIIRIGELETLPTSLIIDKNRDLWGIIEVDDKVYKFNLKLVLPLLDGKDPRVPDILDRLNKLEKFRDKLLLGIDENEVIEP